MNSNALVDKLISATSDLVINIHLERDLHQPVLDLFMLIEEIAKAQGSDIDIYAIAANAKDEVTRQSID